MHHPRTTIGTSRSTAIASAVTLLAAASASADWTFEASPNPGAFTNQLFGVDGSSSNNVWAVGFSSDALLDRLDTLAMHWDGTDWTAVPTPNPNDALQHNTLRAVTVIDADDAWAVGGSTFGPNTTPLFLHWNGSSWARDDDADGFPFGAFANAVHAIAADDVWAMGAITTGGTGFGTLAAHFDGDDWTPFNVSPATFGGLEFQSVDGIASDDVWAAGYENPGSGIFSPLLAHWDGREWTSLTPPQSGAGGTLHAISMLASDDVWAVGQSFVAPFGDQPYAVHWDGSSWTVAPMPIFADGHARLEGVVTLASDDVWAAGTNGDAGGIPRTLIMHYDGVAWQEVETPRSGGSHEWFHALAAIPGGEMWSVGQYFDGSDTVTITARMRDTVAGDVDGDGSVDSQDLALLLGGWGPCAASGTACRGDFDRSGSIDAADLLVLLANWD